MSCQYCGGSHSAFDPCPEMLAASRATVQKHTLGTKPPINVQQIDEAVRVVESLMQNARWVLISPNGDMWAERDPKRLVQVLLTRLDETRPTIKRPELGSPYVGRGSSVAEAMDDFFKKTKMSVHSPLELEPWKHRVCLKYPHVLFTREGDMVSAHREQSLKSDVIGTWAPGHCTIDNDEWTWSDDNPSFG